MRIGIPYVGDKEKFYGMVKDMFMRGELTNNGQYVRELEGLIREYLDVRHCILTCNGTIALQIACKAMGLGGRVLMPSFTFIATAHALSWIGIEPIFVDIDPITWALDPELLKQYDLTAVSAVMPVNIYGQAVEVGLYQEFCHNNGLGLIFDSAQAFGSEYEGRKLGGFGDFEVFSFHATKAFNTFEGGCLTTNNDELAEKARRMRNFGFVPGGDHEVGSEGTNGKMTEIQAAMGIVNLYNFEEVIARNHMIHHAYKKRLNDIVDFYDYFPENVSNQHYTVIKSEYRDRLYTWLQKCGIETRKYFYPGCHNAAPYNEHSWGSAAGGWNLPVTEKAIHTALALPSGPISIQVVNMVSNLIRGFYEKQEDKVVHISSLSEGDYGC